MIEKRTISDGSVRWKARVKSGGRVVAQRTFRKKGDAEAWEREQYRALSLGSFVSPRQGKTSVSDAVATFLDSRRAQVSPHAHRTDSDNLAGLPATFLARPVASITDADVLDVLTALLGRKAHSTVSRTRTRTSLSAFFTWAVRERYVGTHPVRGVRLPPGAAQAPDAEWFTPESLVETLAAQREASEHYALVTEWLSLTGLRWSECRALRVRDLQDLPFPAVRVSRAHSEGYAEKAPKTARGRRTVPLTNRACEIARAFAAEKSPADYLLTTATGKQLRVNLYRRFARWPVTAPGKRVHLLRHYCASEWLRAGIPINQVAAWLGDDPRTVLKVYAHILGERQDIEALERLNSAASTVESGPSQDPRRDSDTTPRNDRKEERPSKPQVRGREKSGDGGI